MTDRKGGRFVKRPCPLCDAQGGPHDAHLAAKAPCRSCELYGGPHPHGAKKGATA
jgi:hypothetical protein